jgi:hypothetical protein
MRFGPGLRPSEAHADWRGQAIVELALVLPILLLVILGTVNLGWLVTSQVILTHAAWEGARAGATLSDPVHGDEEIVAAVLRSAAGLDNTRLVTEISPSQDEYPRNQPWPMPRGHPLTIRLQYPLTLNLPVAVTVPLRAEAVTRMEYQNP